ELRLTFLPASCVVSVSKVESQGCSYGIHMLCFSAAVVLPHVVEIQNDLALGQQHFSEWATPQRLLKADGKTVPVPGTGARVVEDLRRNVRSNGASFEKINLPLNRNAITVTKRKVSVDEAEIFTIAIAQQQLTRKQLSERLLGQYSVLFIRLISVSHGGPETITGAQDDMVVRNVIDVRSDLCFKALSVTNLSILNGLADRAE